MEEEATESFINLEIVPFSSCLILIQGLCLPFQKVESILCVCHLCVCICVHGLMLLDIITSRVYMAVCTASSFMRGKSNDMRQGGLLLNTLKGLVASFVVISFFHL